MKDLSRLYALRNAAIEVDKEMNAERGRFEALRLESSAPRAVTAFNLFQTPKPTADKMAKMIVDHIGFNGLVLEPSAGLGRLYRAMRENSFNGKIFLIEQSKDLTKELYEMSEGDNVSILQRDFLSVKPYLVNGVIMNPPFKRGLDIKHIKHALNFIADGGLLVALCYNGARQNRELKPLCDSWEVLPEKSFKESGTNASIVLLTIKSR